MAVENQQEHEFFSTPLTPSGTWVDYQDEPEQRPWLMRFVWVVLGFNIGFVLPTALAFIVLPLVAPDLAPRRSANANEVASGSTPLPEFVIVTGIPTETPLPTATQTPEPTLPPTEPATLEVTEEVEVAELLPSATPTLLPTWTPVPPSPTPLPAPASYSLSGFTFFRQTWNNCGPANLAMGLSYYGWEGNQANTAAFLKPNREDKNVSPDQMVAYVTENTGLRAIYRVAGTLENIKWLVANEFVVIIESGYTPPAEAWYGHYRLVVGYDDSRAEFQFYDSNLGSVRDPMRPQNYIAFDQDWQAFNRTYIVIYPPHREQELVRYLGTNWNPIANWRLAADVAREEAANEPDNGFAWFNLGTALTNLGEYQMAARAFDQARSLNLPWRMLWYQFAIYEAYFQASRLDDVEALAQSSLAATPYVEETYFYLGKVNEVRGNIEQAKVRYEEALRYNENFRPAQEALTRIGA